MTATQPAEAKLYEALMKAQAEFPAIKKTKTAKVGKYSYKYAELGDILREVTPVLAKHGLVVLQMLRHHEQMGLVLETRLATADGEWIWSEVPLGQSPSDPQAFGTALTYLRRYSLTALLGIATEDDTDAQNVAKPAPVIRTNQDLVDAQHAAMQPEPLIDSALAESLAGQASDLNLLDRVPLAAAHIRGGAMIPEFTTPQELVDALRVLTISEGARLRSWLDKKQAEQAGQTEMTV